LTRALDSIINQTYKNLQIILVDDGSEDNSIQIANEYIEKDPRFILLKQKNSGQSTARNRALIWAKGTYVYFFDSDDYIKPQTIQILVNESLHNNLDLVLFAGGESFYEDKNLERKFPQYKEYYKKKCEYNDVYNGCDLYPLMVKNVNNNRGLFHVLQSWH
jgi:glycosyltransferase involved in cell wall biosynthesis